MFGWMGQIMHANLATGEIRYETLPCELATSWLGGRGLGVRLMRDHFRRDPFDADIPLIIAVGPLCGTSAPASSRLSVVSRSPLTGTIFSSSAAGIFAWQLKRTGIDALVVTGRSLRPVILSLTPEGAVLEPADHLWGQGTKELFAAHEDGVGVAGIGPAGERGVLFAGIVMEAGGEAGRGGLGAVMGSKNLKAVTAKGNRETTVAEPERLETARQDAMRLFRASPVISGELGIGEYGTPALVDLLRVRRMTPTANFRATHFPGAVNYSGPAIRRRFSPRSEGCHDCPIRCRQMAEGIGRLPGFDAVSHFGALNLVDDLDAIVAANAICSDAGMDPISAAAAIATLGELRGRFPVADELLELLRQTVARTGPGELLSQGSRRFARESGAPHLSMTVKGLEIPAYDPRGAYGMAFSYCTSSRGACQLSANAHSHEVLRKPVPTDRFSLSGKARIIAGGEDACAALDSIAACPFALFAATLEEYGEMVSAVTGLEFSPRRLREAGARICLTERYYNCANGFSSDDDILPERFYTEAGSDGEGITVPPIDRQRFLEELRKYYTIRGLNHDGCLTDPRFLEALQ